MDKFKKAVFLDGDESWLEPELWKRVDALCEERIIVSSDDSGLDGHLAEADCLVVKLGAKVPAGLMDKAPKLKYVGMNGTGYGGIDTGYATEKGITVTNIAGYSTQAVAEFTLGLLLNHARHLHTARTQTAEGNIAEDGLEGWELAGKKFGIVGAGRIGGRVAELALAMGAEVGYYDIEKKPALEEKGAHFLELDKLLSNADVITLHVPFTPDSEKMLNAGKLDMIKKGAVVVNVTQNEIFDLDALEGKLKEGAFTLLWDHPDEMPMEQVKKLEGCKTCVTYPPIGYLTKEAMAAKRVMLVENMENFLKGTPSNKVN